MDESVAPDDREIYFLVAEFLERTPCQAAAQALKRELLEHRLLGSEHTWTGEALPHLHEDGVLVEGLRRLLLAVRSHVASAFGLTPRYVVPLTEGAFPRTTSGKIQRAAMQQAFLRGSFATASAALDRALGTSSLSAPDFFAAPVWMRKQPALPSPPLPPAPAAEGGVSSVVWLAPSSHHGALRDAWAVQAAAEGLPRCAAPARCLPWCGDARRQCPATPAARTCRSRS